MVDSIGGNYWDSRMSFQDIQGGAKRPGARVQSPSQAVAAGIFQINTAVATFRRLVDAIGTVKDTAEHRQKLSVSVNSLWNELPFSFVVFSAAILFFHLTSMLGFGYCLVGTIRGRGYCSWWRILLQSSSPWANLIMFRMSMYDSLFVSLFVFQLFVIFPNLIAASQVT